ncbi:tyrosyl-DNA phosphodiesterase [Xylaria intraflava]|nr:tyrosyl-DNA phosphodiesterase [Xylaria intraflava]
MSEPPMKRRRLENSRDSDDKQGAGDINHAKPLSLSRPISPPREGTARRAARISSPFQLTTIRDLPKDCNVGAVSLNDLIGDPLIAELWDFNYLHDIEFLMKHLDQDTRALTNVHVVHGSWKKEDANRIFMEQQASHYKNVTLHTAYMPEMFGTHHSKMLVLLRHDDTAQVIIHTANMIVKDWTNMTNGVWRSPLLPKLRLSSEAPEAHALIGSGSRFKFDLLSYLRAYDTVRKVCGPLVKELVKYDFSAVRGALVASVPGKHDVEQNPEKTRWGWQGLKEALKSIPTQSGESDIVVQISSIATLGATDSWLQRTLFDSLSTSQLLSSTKPEVPRPNFKIIFPTPEEIRRSLDGYASGASIHTKIQSAAQTKQLQYLRPLLHHWANYGAGSGSASTSTESRARDAGRKRAAPHIKTYIRYGEKSIDWALLTSANISKQAWGEATNKAGEVRVASWEIGVLVWPELLTGNAESTMVATFKTDEPGKEDDPQRGDSPVVGLRIPYGLPLKKYGDSEVPWVATANYTEPDWMGRVWTGF